MDVNDAAQQLQTGKQVCCYGAVQVSLQARLFDWPGIAGYEQYQQGQKEQATVY
jgi:hypothetical protein